MHKKDEMENFFQMMRDEYLITEMEFKIFSSYRKMRLKREDIPEMKINCSPNK